MSSSDIHTGVHGLADEVYQKATRQILLQKFETHRHLESETLQIAKQPIRGKFNGVFIGVFIGYSYS